MGPRSPGRVAVVCGSCIVRKSCGGARLEASNLNRHPFRQTNRTTHRPAPLCTPGSTPAASAPPASPRPPPPPSQQQQRPQRRSVVRLWLAVVAGVGAAAGRPACHGSVGGSPAGIRCGGVRGSAAAGVMIVSIVKGRGQAASHRTHAMGVRYTPQVSPRWCPRRNHAVHFHPRARGCPGTKGCC